MNRNREDSEERKKREWEDRMRKNEEFSARFDRTEEEDRRREMEREQEAERRQRMRVEAEGRMSDADWYRARDETEREREKFYQHVREFQEEQQRAKQLGTPQQVVSPPAAMRHEEPVDRDIMPEIRSHTEFPHRKPRVVAPRPGEPSDRPAFMNRTPYPNRIQPAVVSQPVPNHSSMAQTVQPRMFTPQQTPNRMAQSVPQPVVQNQQQRMQSGGQNLNRQEPVVLQHIPNRWIPSIPGQLPHNPHIGFNLKLAHDKYPAVIGELNRLAESLNRIVLADLNGPHVAERKAERYTCLDIRTFLEKLRSNVNDDNKRFVTYPHPLATSLSPQYIQSWHYDAFGASAWITYEAKDGSSRWENRYGQVFKFVGGRFRRIEEHPKYFNPNRFFPDDISFWRGENLWDGSYDQRSREYVLEMYRKLDEKRIQWYGPEGENRIQRSAAVDFWSAGNHIYAERDIREIMRIVDEEMSDLDQRNLSSEMVRGGDLNELARMQAENDRLAKRLEQMKEEVKKEQEERIKLEQHIKVQEAAKQSDDDGSREGQSGDKDEK